jgi:hypothetical protein
MAIDDWLDEATPADLDGLALALTDGRIPQLGASASIQRAGFGEEAIAFLRDLEGTPPIYIARLLARLAQERRSADDRYAKVAQLVWSGESEDDEAIRDTRVVLDDLFRRAERHVLIATYVIYDGLAVFRALADRMRTKPGLDVDLYVNMFSKTGSSDDEQREVADYIDTFRRNHWPSSVRLPNIYYDPSVAEREDPRKSEQPEGRDAIGLRRGMRESQTSEGFFMWRREALRVSASSWDSRRR